ncbi:hypothetical protein [Streptomyces sp. NPDC046985]|uniref:hypothetical protein n=1 Tax=Streptomyces sp. NPDC046985 TaxID=3155377 RepID=UPI0033D90E86
MAKNRKQDRNRKTSVAAGGPQNGERSTTEAHSDHAPQLSPTGTPRKDNQKRFGHN